MTTDELLQKLPSHIGNSYKDGFYFITNPGDDIKWLYLHNDGKDWLASYGVEGEFLCMGQLENGLYDNAFAYGSTPNEALQGLYDWCVEHGFIENSTIKFTEPQFEEGDWIVDIHGDKFLIIGVGEKDYELVLYNDTHISLADINLVDEHYHLWEISDAKTYDVLKGTHGCLVLCKRLDDDYECLVSSCSYSNGLFELSEERWLTDDFVPANKKEHDFFFKKLYAKIKEIEALPEILFDYHE